MVQPMASGKRLTESDRIRIAALEARAVSCREGRRLVEKKQLGVAFAEHSASTILEAELAADPAPRGKTALQKRSRARVVEPPSPVPEHGAAFRRRHDLAEGRYPVLERHGAMIPTSGRCRRTPGELCSLGLTWGDPSP